MKAKGSAVAFYDENFSPFNLLALLTTISHRYWEIMREMLEILLLRFS
jgi:hypothetical protein